LFLLLCFSRVGTFDNYDNSTDLDAWSFGDRTINNAEWKTYIHGPSKMSDWVTIDDEYMDLSAHNWVRQGAAVKLNPQSRWPDAGATMLRTELVAEFGSDAKDQTIMSGTRFFHISLRQPSTNPLDENYEHQLVFMELQGGRHWLDIKYGVSDRQHARQHEGCAALRLAPCLPLLPSSLCLDFWFSLSVCLSVRVLLFVRWARRTFKCGWVVRLPRRTSFRSDWICSIRLRSKWISLRSG
jgi:hypothetical protein